MKRIFIDPGKCDGCMNCSLACMNAHRAAPVPGTAPDPGATVEEQSVYTLDLTDPANEARNFIHADGKGGYLPLFCRHCARPECVSSCMSGALQRDQAAGQVRYDPEKCAACFMCVMNCPYGLPKPDQLTRSKVVKCDFCVRLAAGPSCVRACPTGALWIEEVAADTPDLEDVK